MSADQGDAGVIGARGDDAEALGPLLESFRPFLLAVANRELRGALRVKCAASDLVQETMLDAQRGFADYRGQGAGDLRAWLRGILRFNAAGWARRYRGSNKRAIGRERSLGAHPEASSLVRTLVDRQPTPSACALAREEAQQLDAAIERLPADERAVILARNRDQLAWEEIGHRLDRSAEAARKLWGRAVERLQAMIGSNGKLQSE